jgi:hypothetical protein
MMRTGQLDASIAFVANPREEDFKPFGSAIPDYNAYNMITQVWNTRHSK